MSNEKIFDNQCVCPVSGYCQKFQKNQTARQHYLCQTDERYRRLWAGIPQSRHAPQYTTAVARKLANKDLPGTVLKELLALLGARSSGCGGCTSMIANMNHWGVAGCRLNRDKIIAEIAGKVTAKKLLTAVYKTMTEVWEGRPIGYQISVSDPIGSLVDLAIDTAERRSPRVEATES